MVGREILGLVRNTPRDITDEEIEAIRQTIPELPDAKSIRYQKEFGLSEYDAQVLSEDYETSTIFDSIVHFVTDKKDVDKNKFAKFTANAILGPIKTYLNDFHKSIQEINLGPKYFWETYDALSKSQISTTVARQIILESYLQQISPLDIARNKGLLQVSDSSKIETFAKQVIDANPKAVTDYKKNPNSIGFLVGQLMKFSGGAANPQLAKEILEKNLNTKD